MNTCPRCGGVVTVWADNSDGVTVNFRCPNETCRAGKGPWDTPEPEIDPYDEVLMCECEQDWNCPLHRNRAGTWIETRYDHLPD